MTVILRWPRSGPRRIRPRRSGRRPSRLASLAPQGDGSESLSRHRLADLVDLHRTHALVVGLGVQPADLEAGEIVHEKTVGAHAVELADVAREQAAALLVGKFQRRQRLPRIGLHGGAEGVIA